MPGFEIIDQEEFNEVKEVFDSGAVFFRHGFDAIRNDTYKVQEFEKKFGAEINSQFCLAVTSGTAALRVALAALNLTEEDEVLTQSFTFVATVEAIIESRATPRCVNIDKTLNMDPADLKLKITKKTKAVIVVHMLGVPARLEEISNICKENGIALIEDTAWGCGGKYKGTNLGNYGDIGTFSFDYAKTMTTGEGGMISFKDKKLYKKAAAWHDHGHENNPSVPRWEDTRSSSGFNYRMMELQGAIGLAQLRKLKYVVEKQRDIRDKIVNKIMHLNGITFREMPEGSYDTADALVFFVDSKDIAIMCREALLGAGISTKILPEAYTWHFAGKWDHMKELVSSHENNLEKSLQRSNSILSKAVAIPINLKSPNNIGDVVYNALEPIMN